MGLTSLGKIENRRWWTGVFLAALAIRLLWLVVWEAKGLSARLGFDPYLTIALYWHGWGPQWLDVTHPPLFPMWIYLLFSVLGRPWWLAIQLANGLFSAASCVALGFWAEGVLAGRPQARLLARLAGLWAAFDPLLVFFSIQLQSEPFFVFLELLFFLALLKRPSALSAFGIGVLGGLVSLARSVFGLFAAPLSLALWWRDRKAPRAWLWALVCAGWILAPALWGARNKAKHGTFIPLAINGGWNLWEGFTLDRDEVRRRPLEMSREAAAAGLDIRNAIACGEYFAAKTKAFVREHPLSAAKIVAGKFFLYWRPWPYDPHQRGVRAALAVYFSVLFVLAALGAWTLKDCPALAPVWALFLYLSALHSVFFTSLRYRSPLEPFLCFFAAAGLLRLLGRSADAPSVDS